MNVPDELIYNFLLELKKKDINPIDRAKIINDYCKEKDLSMRGLAKELGMSHSTLQDWADYSRITKDEYSTLTDRGLGQKQIYRALRNTRSKEGVMKAVINTELNSHLIQCATILRPHLIRPECDDRTIQLIFELKNILNRIELQVEKSQK